MTMCKCCYSKCKYKNKLIEENSDYVVLGNKYFHAECKHELDTVNAIYSYWLKFINPDEVRKKLKSVISDIVYTRNVNPDYLLFAIKKKKEHLNYSPAMYYLAENKTLMAEWNHIKAKEKNEKEKASVKINEKESKPFTYKKREGLTFNSIFGGK